MAMTQVAQCAAGDDAIREGALAVYDSGDREAAARIGAALTARPLDGGLLIADATLALEARRPGALDRLRGVLATAPDWLDGHVSLARLRWGAGERDGFLGAIEAALAAMPRHAGLWMRYMTLLADSGQAARAADVAARLRRSGDTPSLRLLEARYAGLAGNLVGAGALLAGLPEDMPDRTAELARHRLRVGDHVGAIPLLDHARGQAPEDVRLWALTELAWRAAGDSRHEWLIRPGLIGTMPVAIDGAVLSAVADRLRDLHRRRWPPLGHSVRSGTQTRGDLGMLGDGSVQTLFAALRIAVTRHRTALPPLDPTHPLLRHRDAALRIANGWSIRIDGAGHHVGHIHPAGVLSSAFYVSVPSTFEGAAREGWLELGRPPADIALDLEPVAVIKPVRGHLALFPSYLYHGTRPFGGGERMSVAFDVAPS